MRELVLFALNKRLPTNRQHRIVLNGSHTGRNVQNMGVSIEVVSNRSTMATERGNQVWQSSMLTQFMMREYVCRLPIELLIWALISLVNYFNLAIMSHIAHLEKTPRLAIGL
jgi:hypothetical protein